MNLIPAKMLNAYRAGDADVAVSADWANLAATKVIDANTVGLKFKHVEDLISAEEVARISGDAVLNAAIAAVQADVDQNELDTDASVASLESAVALDLSIEIEELKDLVDDEEARATAAEATLNGAIIAEAAARSAGDNTLASVDVVLSNRINVEQSRAESIEIILSTDISQEIEDTNADVISIDSAISTEESLRISSDAVLQSQIDELDLDYVSDTDFVVESADFNQVALLGLVGNDMSAFDGQNVFSFNLPAGDTLVTGTMMVFINGIEIPNAESNYSNSISLPFDIELNDTLTVKYIRK